MSEIRIVSVMDLGVTEYEDSLEIMKKLQQKRIDDHIIDTIIFLQHPEVVTVGPRARNDGVMPPSGYPTFPVDRGGGLTWHGPGQLVAYPIFKWDKDDEKSVAQIISKLEEWILKDETFPMYIDAVQNTLEDIYKIMYIVVEYKMIPFV